MKLDYFKMLSEIDELVNNDFCADMEGKQLCGKYIQKEAKDMARLLALVYSISHAIHCEACQTKYKI